MTISEKNNYQAELFSNRLAKNYRQLKKWARKNRITCYRLYDRDIPEIPLAADLYTFLPDHIHGKMEVAEFLKEENAAISSNSPLAKEILADEKRRSFLHIYLYERPYEKDEAAEEEWLFEMKKAAAKTLDLPQENIILKTRRKQSAKEESARNQYKKIESEKKIEGIIQEQGQIFKINLSDYIDTGLFFDHRPLRDFVRNSCSGKSVLNLFCYTGSFSVYAAQGNAKKITSVDLSNTYLEWAKENMLLNDFCDENKYFFVRQDASEFLSQMNEESAKSNKSNLFDIIILDPPTFSNSKRTKTTLDINRDWSDFVAKCLNLLTPKGILYFSTNSRRLNFREEELSKKFDLSKINIEEITQKTIPLDYRNSKIHKAWKISLK